MLDKIKFTDKEKRLLLAAIMREEKVCKKMDKGAKGEIALLPIIRSAEWKLKHTSAWIE